MSIKEYKLGYICTLFSGSTPRRSKPEFWNNTNTNWFTSSEICRNMIASKEKINNDKARMKLVPKNTTLIAMYGVTAGKVGFLNSDSTINQAICAILESPKIRSKYIYYNLINKNKFIKSLASGSAQQNLSVKKISEFKIIVPDIETQQQIIDIIEPFENNLCNVHKKISIMKLIMKLIKVDERGSKLVDVSKIFTGKQNANFSNKNGKYRFFSCSDSILYCDEYKYDGEYLLLSGNGDVGNVKYFNGKFEAYQRTYIIKTNLIGNVYLSLIKNKNFLEKSSNGSVVKFLTIKSIENIMVSTSFETNLIATSIIRYIFLLEKITTIISRIINILIEKYVH